MSNSSKPTKLKSPSKLQHVQAYAGAISVYAIILTILYALAWYGYWPSDMLSALSNMF